ncbi:MAG: NUDIX hydrolase [Magnetococcales bacterium]|nr:NUDIX hydrolase [Magnetococcales bacterium]
MSITIDPIDAYLAFKEEFPCFFQVRTRRLVTDPRYMRAYRQQHGVALGLLDRNPWVAYLVDLVESMGPGEEKQVFPYLRVINLKETQDSVGVVVVGIIAKTRGQDAERLVLIHQERHATGKLHWEVPRGFGEPGIDSTANALKELAEETGFQGKDAIFLGCAYPDSGLTNACVHFYWVPILEESRVAWEAQEVITEQKLVTVEEFWHMVVDGRMQDGFSIQAVALYERFKTRQNGPL